MLALTLTGLILSFEVNYFSKKIENRKKKFFLPVFINFFDSIFVKIRILKPCVGPIFHVIKKKTLKPSILHLVLKIYKKNYKFIKKNSAHAKITCLSGIALC
jgi:hypothetical protein